MAAITAISRCAGLNHIHLIVQTSVGDRELTIEQSDLTLPAPLAEIIAELTEGIKKMNMPKKFKRNKDTGDIEGMEISESEAA